MSINYGRGFDKLNLTTRLVFEVAFLVRMGFIYIMWRNSSLVLLIVGISVLVNGCKTSRKITSNQKDVRDSTSALTAIDSLVTEAVIDTIPEIDPVQLPPVITYKDTITTIGVGDIMMATNFPSEDYLSPNNGRDLWADVKDTLALADITFGNLEGVILDEGGEQKECRNPKVCYIFRTPVRYVENLTDAGFDVMSLANNHAGDFGDTGRKSTMSVLDSIGINYAGLINAPYTTFEVEDLTIGFAAFAPNKGTVSIHQPDRIKEIFAHLDSISDIVIASFHAGAEGQEHLHVPKSTETYYGENRGNVYELARLMIDGGADIVFGHGPHVPRAIDLYNNRIIAYSLGNFCTYGRFSLRGEKGISPILKVQTDREGKFLSGKIHSIKLIDRGHPIFDDTSEALDLIRRLTKEDFPEIPLMIDESGRITYIDN